MNLHDGVRGRILNSVLGEVGAWVFPNTQIWPEIWSKVREPLEVIIDNNIVESIERQILDE